MNDDFLVTSEMISQWFSRVTKSRMKIFGKSHHEWPKKSLFTVRNVLFYFLHAILCPEHNSTKNKHRSLISPLSPTTVFPDLVLWHHQSWSMTSRDPKVLALWLPWHSSIVLALANWHKGDLHEWITTVNINFSPPGINSLECKKDQSCLITCCVMAACLKEN